MIKLPRDLLEIVLGGGTVLVPSRQRAHAARLAFAATQLENGVRVWSTPDILPVDAWLIREIEQFATASGAALPRVLSPAEDWLLWRQCTADATRDIELLNRGALAESLRHASSLAAEYGIDISKLPSFPGAESELLHRTQLAVDERYRSFGAASIQSLFAQLPVREVTCAGFLKLPPRLAAIGGTRWSVDGGSYADPDGDPQQSAESPSTRPTVVIAGDESDELERIAGWCKRQIAAQEDARLLVILPGSSGARERLATLIRQAVDPQKWLSSSVADSAAQNLVTIEGGAPLAGVPVVAHALSTLKWLGGSSGEFEEVSEWLRAAYWDAPRAGVRARMDMWLRETGQMSVSVRDWTSLSPAVPSPIPEGFQELGAQIGAAVRALGDGTASPREWSERFRAALDAVHWPGERVRDSSEQQTVVRLHELLDEFGQLASSAGPMGRAEAIHWFSELASRTAFRPADDDGVVTISAALADPVVLYDGIWVAGLHAEAFPQPVQPDPFLPLPAQVAAGIPAAFASGRLAEARGLINAWRNATHSLVLSAPSRAEDLELLPSPLLAPWLRASAETSAEATVGAGTVGASAAAGASSVGTNATAGASTGPDSGGGARARATAGDIAGTRSDSAIGIDQHAGGAVIAGDQRADTLTAAATPSPSSSKGTSKGRGSSKARASNPLQADLFSPQTPPPAVATAPSPVAPPVPDQPLEIDSTAPVDQSSWLAERIHRSGMLEYLDDSIGIPWPQGQALPAGTRSLELQNLCSFRAYSELRLGSSELGVPEPGVAPDERGQLLHAALQILWRELRDSATLAGHAEPTLDNLIEQSVANAADAVLGRADDNVRSPLLDRECRRTVRLIKRLCALELTREPFRVRDTEFEKTLTVSGAQMNVRIDRLDTLGSGGHAILDYKSGRRTTADWYGERPSHPQLLAYLAALGDEVVAMATVNVTAREVRFDGIASSGQLLPKVRGVEPPVGDASGDAWQVRRREWMACVERLAASFLAGRALVDPKPGACDWCHAVSVCRVSDGGIDVTAELLPLKFEGQP
ncbi:MAG: PD-(D/E)XK nuclease family protein [Proteobacteria bacterium]|nr:PD-(D/E)XK nuclease family protein [Pseudomonadota bacterium]